MQRHATASEEDRDDLETAVRGRLSNWTSCAPYPKPEASPRDSVRRGGGFRVPRVLRRTAVLPLAALPLVLPVLRLVRGLVSRPRVRGRDRAIPQRAVVHPLQHRDRCCGIAADNPVRIIRGTRGCLSSTRPSDPSFLLTAVHSLFSLFLPVDTEVGYREERGISINPRNPIVTE